MASTPAALHPSGQVTLSKKFVDGVVEYTKHWPGRITVLMEEHLHWDGMLDPVEMRVADLPFDLRVMSFRSGLAIDLLRDASVVLAPLGERQIPLQEEARSHTARWVYYAEFSVRTRKQMASVVTPNPVRRIRRHLWEERLERRFRRAVFLADGVQCNGTPTYRDYARTNRRPLLYFDGRVTSDLLATPEDVERRHLERLSQKLRILFSGRLIRIKGADHLIDVAAELKRAAIPFEFTICGDGELKPSLERRIVAEGLSSDVKLVGVLDFREELVPFIKAEVDLFVCCHRQGDPSCTYLETMSCGVPVVGYANEALAGLVEISKGGWLVPMDRPKLLARRIAELSCRRDLLHAASLNALEFARQHTFERTFANRVSHLQEVAALR